MTPVKTLYLYVASFGYKGILMAVFYDITRYYYA